MQNIWSAISRRSLLKSGVALGIATTVPRVVYAQENSLVVGVQGLPDSLLMGMSSFSAENLMLQTMTPLVLRDDEGNLKPGLAVKWEAVGDNVWRFELRKDVKFHDGKPFTAEDVKFTLDYILAPDSLYGTKARISQVEKTEIVDNTTVLIHTKGPFPTLTRGLSDIPIEPKHYVEKVGREGMTAHPVGTGPFKFEEWVPGDRYSLTAFDGYWDGKPPSGRLVLRQIPEGSTRVAALLAGEAQIVEELPVDLQPSVEQSDNAEVLSVESTVGLLLTFDTTKPPFDDKRVRQALNYAIDKEKILKRLLMGNGTVLQGQMLTSNTFGFNPDLSFYPYDPGKAKALLEEAGHGDGFETSITTRSGKYLADVDICNVCAAMLGEVGVKTTVNVVEQGVFSKMTSAHDMGPIHMVGWYSLGDADFATVWFTEASGRSFWHSDEYEKLFVEARSTVDENARLKAYHRMMALMHEEAPSIFLFGLPSIYGAAKGLTDWLPPSDKIQRLADAKLG
ncbi:MAG: ABC transporter substrate-binding protein [Hyphomicrobiales bacterium]|nr:ABC transporter substrate-binding protein [Hyphomicrobiales bacterium]